MVRVWIPSDRAHEHRTCSIVYCVVSGHASLNLMRYNLLDCGQNPHFKLPNLNPTSILLAGNEIGLHIQSGRKD